MQNWIFVISSDYDAFKKRIREKKWPIFNRTPNRHNLKIGDRVIFYKAGDNGHKFIGSATIATSLQPEGSIDFSIGLSNTAVWKKQIHILPLLNDLVFVKNKTNWGAYLQGGLRPIGDSDYQKITDNA